MARFLSKLSSRVTTIRYWLRAAGGHSDDASSTWSGDYSTRDMDFFDIGLGHGDAPDAHPHVHSLFPYYASLCLVKVSALLQMLRIFKIPRVRTSILCLLAFVAVFGIWTFVSALLTCHPLAYMWDQTIPGGHCINQLPFLYANAAINIALDILVTLLPLPVLRRLRLTTRQKRGLMAVFALGLLATTTSIIRLRALTDLHNASDFTHAITPLCIWSAIELNTSIACACAPALGPLFTRLASTLHLFRAPRRSDLSVALSAASTCACPSLRAQLSLSFAWRKSAHISVARPRDSVDTDLTDLAEFAGFTGLTGDPDLDGFLLARQASRSDAAARRWARPDTGSTTVDEGEVGRASSTVGIV
ncbi:hypothetical protein SLS56_008249 [Neofusicoccum ribis]|uniref:Rhodopsin domain-containing protein n=1 Tax=Neofusicoccum ribis TaxID=45134 RepID=A0ABR3SKL2_9PEZI